MSQIFCILSNFTTHSLPLKKSTIWVDRLRINSEVLFKPSSSLKPKLDLHWFSKRRKNPVVGKRGEEEDEFGRECLQQFVSSRPQVSCLTRDQQQPALFRVVVEKMLKPQRDRNCRPALKGGDRVGDGAIAIHFHGVSLNQERFLGQCRAPLLRVCSQCLTEMSMKKYQPRSLYACLFQ